jgi:hypothetical protein
MQIFQIPNLTGTDHKKHYNVVHFLKMNEDNRSLTSVPLNFLYVLAIKASYDYFLSISQLYSFAIVLVGVILTNASPSSLFLRP